MQQYTFHQTDTVNVLLDLAHRDELLESRAVLGADRRSISGRRRSRAWAQDQRVYFRTELSRPYDRATVRTGPNGTTHVLLRFAVRAGETLVVKTALSSTSEDGAARNLAAELPGWGFEATRRAADRRLEPRTGQDRGAGRQRARPRELLHRPLPHDDRPERVERRRRAVPRARRARAHGPYPGRASTRRLHRLLALGHVPHRPSALHAPRPGAHDGLRPLLPAPVRAGRAAARVGALGQRDQHDDRLPQRAGDPGGVREGHPRLRRRSRAAGHARRRADRGGGRGGLLPNGDAQRRRRAGVGLQDPGVCLRPLGGGRDGEAHGARQPRGRLFRPKPRLPQRLRPRHPPHAPAPQRRVAHALRPARGLEPLHRGQRVAVLVLRPARPRGACTASSAGRAACAPASTASSKPRPNSSAATSPT